MQWHFLVSPAGDGPANMALDEALMRRAARTGDAVFRVYEWSAPTLSLGRHQRARGCYDLPAAHDRGVRFVRRPTGGRALLHHREITYSVTMPARDPADASRAYEFINGILLAGLAAIGVRADRATGTEAVRPGLRPCFDAPSTHEIVLGKRKLVGSAQWRHDGSLLQHGSILIHDDQPMIGELLCIDAPDTGTSAATLFQALGHEPSADDVASALRLTLGQATGVHPCDLCADRLVASDAADLRNRYADDSWTWRR